MNVPRRTRLVLFAVLVAAVCLAGQVAAVAADPPGAFGKTSPPNGATGLWSPITLSWGTATGDGVGYRYCVDTINNGVCDFGWYVTGTVTSALVEAVSFNTTYYWQVQAYNGGGSTDADSGTWASFSTPAGPAGFGKTAPANGATGVALNPTPLTWGSEAYGDYFVYCLDTTNDDACDGGYWTPIGMVTSIDRFGLAPNTTYYWQVYAEVQTWGPVYADGGTWWSFTTAPVLQEMAFRSVAAYDGWVLEQDESSGKGGTFDAAATTARVGDDASDRQWRSILHFDTGGLPDGAVVTGVTLRVKRQSIVGGNPFDTHGYLTVDQKTGAYHEDPVLEKLDFHAVGSRGNVGRFIKTPSSGWYRAPLRAPSYPLINLTGTTQFRLRFATDDNDNGVADYLSFYTGNAPEADRPQLIVTYYVP